MTSIELLLADAGLLSLTENPEYNTDSSSLFFDDVTSTVTRSNFLPAGVSAGTYEATKFSGLSRFYLRALLANAVYKIMLKIGTSEENVIKICFSS